MWGWVVIAIDELSLIRNQPDRVWINCRDVQWIRGYIEIFIGRLGYDIKISADVPRDKQSTGGHNDPDGRPDDKPNDKDNKDDSLDDDKDSETYLKKLQKEYVVEHPKVINSAEKRNQAQREHIKVGRSRNIK